MVSVATGKSVVDTTLSRYLLQLLSQPHNPTPKLLFHVYFIFFFLGLKIQVWVPSVLGFPR